MPAPTPPNSTVLEENFSLRRMHVVVPLLILQLWPWFVVMDVSRFSPAYKNILGDMIKGARLPELTRFLFETYQWWWMVPMCTTALALTCFSRRVKTLMLPTVCLALTLISGVVMKQIFFEGTMGPITTIIRNLANGGQ